MCTLGHDSRYRAGGVYLPSSRSGKIANGRGIDKGGAENCMKNVRSGEPIRNGGRGHFARRQFGAQGDVLGRLGDDRPWR